jgi:hypothetical protein
MNWQTPAARTRCCTLTPLTRCRWDGCREWPCNTCRVCKVRAAGEPCGCRQTVPGSAAAMLIVLVQVRQSKIGGASCSRDDGNWVQHLTLYTLPNLIQDVKVRMAWLLARFRGSLYRSSEGMSWIVRAGNGFLNTRVRSQHRPLCARECLAGCTATGCQAIHGAVLVRHLTIAASPNDVSKCDIHAHYAALCSSVFDSLHRASRQAKTFAGKVGMLSAWLLACHQHACGSEHAVHLLPIASEAFYYLPCLVTVKTRSQQLLDVLMPVRCGRIGGPRPTGSRPPALPSPACSKFC